MCSRCSSELPPGRGFLCEKCDEAMALIIADFEGKIDTEVASNLRRSGLPDAYVSGERRLQNVERFARKAVTACMELGKSLRGLYIWGTTNTYKTSVSAAFLAAAMRKEKKPGIYVKSYRLIDDILASYKDHEGAETRAAIVKRMVSAPYLVIDDFGKEKASEHSARVIFEILDGRFENPSCADAWTIITSNWNPNEVAFRFDIPAEDRDPIRRRLSDLTVSLPLTLEAA